MSRRAVRSAAVRTHVLHPAPGAAAAAAAALGILLAVAIALPAAAQPADRGAAPPPPTSWAAGFRAGAFDMVNSPDSYDAVYGDLMPRVGGHLEMDRGRRLRFTLSLDYGQVDGERVILGAGGVGIDQELTLAPLHLTAAWRFRPQRPWVPYLGIGPSLLWWEDSSAFGSESGNDVGGSAVLGLRRQGGGPWDLGGELRWSTFPDALPTDGPGVTAAFGEDDPGGLSLTVLAVRRF